MQQQQQQQQYLGRGAAVHARGIKGIIAYLIA